jgi:hypothetical protein
LIARGDLATPGRRALFLETVMTAPARRRPSRWTYLTLILGVALGASTCVFHRGTKAPDTRTITEDEIDSVHAASAYDAIKRLRPQFLNVHGRASFDPHDPPALPNVYVDKQYYGDISALRGISGSIIESIRFYSAAEAQYTFGRGNMAGAISIITKH